jgi:hypothetical protein
MGAEFRQQIEVVGHTGLRLGVEAAEPCGNLVSRLDRDLVHSLLYSHMGVQEDVGEVLLGGRSS